MTIKRKNQFRSHSSFRRKIGIRAIRQRFLIVCEGEKTEPNYFRSFHVSSAVLLDIRGIGANTDSLVKRAIDEKAAVNKTVEAFDQVWCVFDRDSFPVQNFNNAFNLAAKNGINIAFSNEAFELWYLLHFSYLQSSLSRQQYCDKLSEQLCYKYEKNSTSIYYLIQGKQADAIRNAEKLLTYHTAFNPEKSNPSTTVHLLVKELNKYRV